MTIKKAKEKGIPVLETAPDGFRKIDGARTAPIGYAWYNNRKSRFGDEYKAVLVRE